jgi:transcriptional regulator with XRE-family HTH domain
MPPPVFNMIPMHNLRWYRKRANVSQQDVATLLDIIPQTLIRYENGSRDPTPEIIIVYHILFGVTLHELFTPFFKKIKQKLVERSKIMIDDINHDPSPKGNQRITYLQSIVNSLEEEKSHESDK